MKIMYRILMVILVVCIPVTAILAAYNAVLRLPDLYTYQFNDAQVTKEIGLRLSGDELGEFFSDYMLGKEENFSLVTDFRDREQEVFALHEQLTMAHIRALLDISLWVFAGGALLIFIVYGISLTRNKKISLRSAYKFGVFLYLFLAGLSVGAFYYPETHQRMRDFLFQIPFGEEDVLPLMLTEAFARNSILFALAGGVVLLLVLGSVTWRLTKPRRMFSNI